ncbi:MAG: HD domain-containing protein [Phycisphaerae bacterium]|nr:HD domain-containing protein [Phycisphaerae bacterium]
MTDRGILEKERCKAEKRFDEEELESPKYIRDPVHDIIKITDQVILDLINSQPMQRLRRIRQLGVANLVFPGAEHSRFTHSLGVYHLARRMVNRLNDPDKRLIDSYNRRLVIIAALLHDVGHGPFSHLFEAALKEVKYGHAQEHEWWSTKIVMENSEIVRILDDYSPELKKDVKNVISHSVEPEYLSSIVSSQLDVDRFDYMLRDSLMTGVNYGRFDLNWVFRNLSLTDVELQDEDDRKAQTQKIALGTRRGLSSLEEFLLGNLHMYDQVYYHKSVLAASATLLSVLNRALQLLRDGKNIGVDNAAFRSIADDEPMTLDDYLALDDLVVWSWLVKWSGENGDQVLRDLSQRLLSRKPFKALDLTQLAGPKYKDVADGVSRFLGKQGMDPKFYAVPMDPQRVGYKCLSTEEIFISEDQGPARQYSTIISRKGHEISKTIVNRLEIERTILAVPPEHKEKLEEIAKEIVS